MVLKDYLHKTTSAAPLAVFRVALGILLFASIVRFWCKGWIDQLYIQPKHFFSYYGFEFVRPIGEFTYIIFVICGLCALLVALGLFYRVAIIGLFLSFTYIELMDKSTYLNHYYFISMVCLMMIFLPANRYFSLDAARQKETSSDQVPRWCIDALKVFVCIVYLYAGLAKLNSDWLLHAQPLRTWLPAKNDLPLIGPLFNHVWVAYAFSWMGCLYDLSVPFLLMNRKTRVVGYGAVIVFHTITSVLFPIGMFPYIMMATALIFFSPEFHGKLLSRFTRSGIPPYAATLPQRHRFPSMIYPVAFSLFLLVQAFMPLRHVLYPGELFWTEEGYRFSWRVMLMEKAGHAIFTVVDSNGRQEVVDNQDFLTPLQEKMMATQPDMILQFAHILRDHYIREGFQSPQVYVDSYVVLNGRLGRPMIDPYTDLAQERDSFKHKPWILTFDNEIKGM